MARTCKTVAAIDLGSQTFRLAIAGIRSDDIRILASELYNVRLAEGLSDTSLFSDHAIRNGIKTLRHFRRIMDRWNVTAFSICGTAAFRKASNASCFLDLAEKTGLPVNILSPEEEAALAAKGVRATLPPTDTQYLVADIGGGSSEFILADMDRILYKTSLPAGAVNLTEQFPFSDPPEENEIEKLESSIQQIVEPVCMALPGRPGKLIGVGGTATTLAALILKMETYDPFQIRGFRISCQKLDMLWHTLKSLTVDQRKKLPGLESRRADIIMAGFAIFKKTIEILRFKELTVSDGGLLLGLLIDIIEKEFFYHAQLPDTGSLYL
ncbi:MAG TPA: hypothetical protein EYP57_10250 [Thermodesulfobacteriaceae bacterium]|nr:hypothetical protein [Thermodesulfobacteriaceae bacterium]